MNGKIFTGYLVQMLEKYGDIPLIEAVERWKNEMH